MTKKIQQQPAQPTLDDQLMAWLAERNAGVVHLAISAKGGALPVEHFMTADGLRIPAGWTLTVTVVEAKPK